MKVLTIGGATQDIFICQEKSEPVSRKGKDDYMLIRSGSKIEVSDLLYYTGGGSTNAAVSFKKLGFDAECFCKVGGDEAGKTIVDTLNKAGVKTDNISIAKDKQSGKAFIISSSSGEQTVFVHRGVTKELTKEELPIEVFKNIDLLYITSLNGKAAKLLPYIVEKAKELNVKVAVNPGSIQMANSPDLLKEALKNIDIFILNKCEAKNFNRFINKQEDFEIKTFIKQIVSIGPKVVVLTDGSKGVWAGTTSTLYFHPATEVKVVGSLGAGDAFGSCFVGMLEKNDCIEDALRSGILNSASVISEVGTKNGLLTYDKLKEAIKDLDVSLLEKTPL